MIENPYVDSENREYYDMIRRFARDKVFPSVLQREAEQSWSPELWQDVCDASLAGLTLPEEYGGQGANCFQGCLAGEAMVAGSADSGFMLSWGAHFIIGAMPIVLFGSDEQKKKYLPGIASGQVMAGLGLTEPGSGSDAAAMATFAEARDGGFVVNGSKMFITNGNIGDVFVVMVRTKKSRGPMGVSALIVEKGFKGFSVGKVLHKLGHMTSATSELIFEDMFVPEANLLGPLHSGFMRIGRATLEWERAALGAGNVGSMAFTLEQGLGYAEERAQFGKPIIEFYAIKEKLVKNWLYLQVSRRYVYYLAKRKDDGIGLPMQASILKCISSELAEEIASEIVQLHGGYGYMKEYHVERIYRDIKLGTIGGGTSEVQRSIIAASFPGMAKWQAMVEDLAPIEARQRAASLYPASLAGSELELLAALNQLIQNTHEKVKKAKSQYLAFAFADLLALVSFLQQTYWDVGIDHEGYSTQSKQRDFILLCHFLLARYIKSLKALAGIDQPGTAEVIRLLMGLSGIEKKIDDCLDEIRTIA